MSDVLLLPQLVENVVFAIARRRTATAGTSALRPVVGRHGKIVTVFSPKGGTGKTVTATNLATACAKFEGRKTLLLDLDLQFGDAAIMLGVEPEKTIYDLVVAPGELDTREARRLHDEARVRTRDPARAASPGRRGARDGGEARPAARGCTGVVRRHRRRHVPVLPRADAGDARPDGRAAAPLRARRADAQEPAPGTADARPALVPEVSASASSSTARTPRSA